MIGIHVMAASVNDHITFFKRVILYRLYMQWNLHLMFLDLKLSLIECSISVLVFLSLLFEHTIHCLSQVWCEQVMHFTCN
jgi:hypothetical protein